MKEYIIKKLNLPIFSIIAALSFVICNIFSSPLMADLGEVYSETTYVPQYGLLNESHVRFYLFKSGKVTTYLGFATQAQWTTKTNQTDLYERDRLMPLLGVRAQVWKTISFLAELRTEERSRVGLYSGNIWEYQVTSVPVFSEYYAEAMILPSFHHSPLWAAWVKQGLRFRPQSNIFLDPFLEFYSRISPDPDLGRDTQQFRVGVRSIYLIGNWSVSALLYQSYSFKSSEKNHEEGLLVIGGTF